MEIPPKLSPDIIDELISVALHKAPTDFEFISHTWPFTLHMELKSKIKIPFREIKSYAIL